MGESQNNFFVGVVKVPKFFYGTAWKEETTTDLTLLALQAGFRAVDTANQRKHYHEEGVGEGVRRFLDQKEIKREDLFLQTKFTFARGQDHRKPYDEKDSYTKQVNDSFASSLRHLGTDYLDSYVLHGPYSNEGIGSEDLESWNAMEAIFESGRAKLLGISNVSPEQLEELCEKTKVKPSFVQNRCYARLGWDFEVRQICLKNKIIYQGFSLLTANQREIASSKLGRIAQKYGKTLSQVIFRFSQQLGMITLTGTTNPMHMGKNLNIYDFELSPQEISEIEGIALN